MIDHIAQKYGCTIVRSSPSVVDMMTKLSEINKGSALCTQFILEFDPVGGLIKIMDFLKSERKSLKSLIDEIPNFYVQRQEIPFANGQEIPVLSRLARESGVSDFSLSEGVRIQEENGWVLVTPDRNRSAFQIISEGYNVEMSKELMNKTCTKIKELLE